MSAANQALWLNARQDPTMRVGPAPYSSPSPREVVIATAAAAMNPADWMLQQTGMLISKYPAILGCDAAGEVVAVGKELEHRFQIGDRVFGAAGPLEGYKYSAFQRYVVLKAPSIARIPSSIEFSQAVVLPLGFNTAASCLFAKETLGLETPPSSAGHGKVVLIWGASSSLGCCGVQLAAAAGYEVVAIASTRNHELLRFLGADACYDYNDVNIITDVTNYLKDKHIMGAFDCISNAETIRPLCEILENSNAAQKVIAAIQPGSEAHAKCGVAVTTNFLVDQALFQDAIANHLWQKFLPQALEAGTFQYKPDADVVGHGLESVQEAIDLLSKGVSAKKLVVTL